MNSKIIVYFSRAGENYFAGEVRSISKGNTETVVEYITKKAKFDTYKIEMAKPYPQNYGECVEQATYELKRMVMPELKGTLPNLDKYDDVILAYPNYLGTMPRAVFSFLNKYNWVGKNIYPICTNEGGGLGNSVDDIKALCTKAWVKSGLSIYGGSVDKAETEALIEKWLWENDLM